MTSTTKKPIKLQRKPTPNKKEEDRKNEEPLIVAGFAVSIAAILLSWVPFLGLIFSLISAGLLIAKLIKDKKITQKLGLFIAGAILSIIALFISTSVTISSINKQIDENQPKLKEPDTSAMTVKEACSVIKEEGWQKITVKGAVGKWSIRTASCSDSEKVKYVNYSQANKKLDTESAASIVFELDEDDLTRSEQKKLDRLQDDSSSSSSKSKNSDSKSKSKSNSGSQKDSSSSSSSDSEWKKFLKEYETWVDKYIAFMKKYKNASPSDIKSMASEYRQMISELSAWSSKSIKIQSGLSSSDRQEYIKTVERINEKLNSAK